MCAVEIARQAPGKQQAPVEVTTADRLVAQVARGDRVAFGDLYNEVAGHVYGLTRRLLTDQALVERAFVRAMVTVWREAPRFNSADDGVALRWIMAVAHREVFEVARAMGVRSGPRRADQ